MSRAETAPALIRVGMVGAGMISGYHLRGWMKLPNVEVVAVVDPDAARAGARAREFGIAQQYPDMASLLAGQQVDVLDIASPMETHGELIRLAAQRGIPALCQKPFMPTFEEAAELVGRLDADRSHGSPAPYRLMVNQNFRFRPYYQQMRGWIDQGLVGAISGFTMSCRSSGLVRDADGKFPYIERQPFVRSMQRLMITEILTHRIDLARWLCGPLELVAARTARTCAELAGESEASLLMRVAQTGAPVVVDGNLGCVGMPALSQDRVEIVGSRGRITFENDVLRLHGPSPEEIGYDYAAAYQQSFDATLAHFIEALRTDSPFLTDAADNLQTLQLVEAAYASAAQG